MFRYIITSYTYTKHLIDSVGLVDSVITNVDRERIRIYFRTATEEENGGNSDATQDDNNNDNTQTQQIKE